MNTRTQANIKRLQDLNHMIATGMYPQGKLSKVVNQRDRLREKLAIQFETLKSVIR